MILASLSSSQCCTAMNESQHWSALQHKTTLASTRSRVFGETSKSDSWLDARKGKSDVAYSPQFRHGLPNADIALERKSSAQKPDIPSGVLCCIAVSVLQRIRHPAKGEFLASLVHLS